MAVVGRCYGQDMADKAGEWVEGAENKTSDAMHEAKDEADSWTGWALNKLSE